MMQKRDDREREGRFGDRPRFGDRDRGDRGGDRGSDRGDRGGDRDRGPRRPREQAEGAAE
jgi:small subunit ribosomal protein S6